MANEGVRLVLDWEGDVYKGTTYSYLDAIYKKALSILARKIFSEVKSAYPATSILQFV